MSSPQNERSRGARNASNTDEIELFACNQFGNAERFEHYFGLDFRYCYAWKKWLYWTGTHWAEDDTGEVFRAAETTIRKIKLESKKPDNEGIKKAYEGWYNKSAGADGVSSMLRLAQSKLPVVPGQLDAERFLLSVANGTLDLSSCELMAHNRDDYITNAVGIEFDIEATCPTWHEFLSTVMGGDLEMIGFLQRAVGYSLTGAVGEQVLFFLYGAGANGKSTFTATIEKLLGSYWHKTNAETFMAKSFSGGGPSPEKLALKGKRLVTVSEIGQGQKLDEALVKDLTGGDPITARGLHQAETTFLPQHKIWMYGNHKPKIQGQDTGIWRRIRLIPFLVTIAAEKRDPDLLHKLELELPGILNWALAGLLHWKLEGLQPPEKVTSATDSYKEEMDSFVGFIDECCTEGAGNSCLVSDLYKTFCAWAVNGGEREISKRELTSILKERGYEQRKGAKGKRYWDGLGIAEQPQFEFGGGDE